MKIRKSQGSKEKINNDKKIRKNFARKGLSGPLQSLDNIVYMWILESFLVNKCTKHQFIHLLMATCNEWHIENSKNHTKVISLTITSPNCQWREHFPIGGQWWPCAYLARIRRYGASKILGSQVWPFGVTWRHRSRDHWTRHMWFPIGGPLKPCVYLTPLWRYLTPNIFGSRLWPFEVTYLEFPKPYCLFTIQLLWAYDDD